MEFEKNEDPDEVIVITIKKTGNNVTTEVNYVDGYDPVDPVAIIGALAGTISEYNSYTIPMPQSIVDTEVND